MPTQAKVNGCQLDMAESPRINFCVELEPRMYCPALIVTRESRLHGKLLWLSDLEGRMLGKTLFKTTGDRYC